MLTREEAQARVAKGAAHLDVVRPNWFNEIDVGTLTLHDACGCIAGQLGRVSGMGYISFWTYAFPRDVFDGEACGIYLDCYADDRMTTREHYQPLQDAWIEEIATRRLRFRAAAGVTDIDDARAPGTDHPSTSRSREEEFQNSEM